MRGKLNMNPQTKRAIVVLSIIALLILIIGVGSCSKQSRQPDKNPAGTEQSESSSEPSDGGIVIDPVPKSGETQTGPSTGSNDVTSTENYISTGQEDGGGENIGSEPSASSTKPSSGISSGNSGNGGQSRGDNVPPASGKPDPGNSAPVSSNPASSSSSPASAPSSSSSVPSSPSSTPSGGSSGGSHSKPNAQVSFGLPETAYTDTSIRIVPTLKNVSTLRWTLTRANADGAQVTVDPSKILSETLDKSGGTVTFQESGNYVLTATAANSSGRETVCSHEITVYPVAGVAFSLPESTHTDKAVSITVSGDLVGVESFLVSPERWKPG
ncbi:hypothetical protein [Caproicibacter fermentans]|uniref:Uncharacterized protein n=1 Tax=Caproicibacter fermentans TaxID=2576756 RepID=A0A7G8TF09_9FIRM|nr:hypothetical protein [Caproicibacter fermentans]QNK42200.1 hypothetical protein HCR03_08320 [Caproicibacter fermentans]